MAKPNKAYIKFKPNITDEDYTEIRFHSVISEDHEAENVITKFPVQSGFDISNHSIRKNRKVVIEATITNTQMVLSNEFHEYSAYNNSKAVFQMLEELVRKAIPCIAVTNLGEYEPVIFNKFKTKQKAGMTDAIEFTLSGEEVQVATIPNQSTPVELIFNPVPDSERAALIASFREAGYGILEEANISYASADLNKGFSVGTVSLAGKPTKMVYEHTGFDPATSEHSFGVSISPDDLILAEVAGGTVAVEETLSSRLQNGANVFGACLTESLTDFATKEVDDYVTTVMGDLKKTIYGGLYEALGVNGNRSFGQKLLGLGLDCFIVGATATSVDDGGQLTITPDEFDTDLPTVDDALAGAASHGDSLATGAIGQASPTTIYKVSGSSTGTVDLFGGLL